MAAVSRVFEGGSVAAMEVVLTWSAVSVLPVAREPALVETRSMVRPSARFALRHQGGKVMAWSLASVRSYQDCSVVKRV